MKCGDAIDFMIGMNECIIIRDARGEVITSVSPFNLIVPRRMRWILEKKVSYIAADKEKTISIYIDVFFLRKKDVKNGN